MMSKRKLAPEAQSPAPSELDTRIDFVIADQQETVSKVLLKRRIKELVAAETTKANKKLLAELREQAVEYDMPFMGHDEKGIPMFQREKAVPLSSITKLEESL